ncbi:receptor-type tyrosine-protein phosphatase U-like [Penaeus monodon]|uniref:receptor-type tyrosine-protein phosphatase U-like n=1 Tax=Penaeus monodon TaxID=6687 RepID=UPI0018A7CE34|nr:receptor-type tyrosine-protein phosphatase U-like [Penaeus monodon]
MCSSQVMCVQYWPAMVGCCDHYEGIKVELLKEEQLANFQIRTIRLTSDGHSDSREVVQFHYTEWPSHTQPFINALLEFRRRIRLWMRANILPADGPTIVHCSDGGARTGVFMSIDANLELHEEDGKFDLYGYLKKMRQARRGLIETVDQYRFVFDALEEFLLCGYSFFPVSELSQRLKHKSMKVLGNKSEYQLNLKQNSCAKNSIVVLCPSLWHTSGKRAIFVRLFRVNFCGFSEFTDEEKAIGAIPTKPINSGDLERICAEHRKYPILYKVEFQIT